MLVCKDLFVPGAKVTHAFMVSRLHVPMKIGPAETGKITGWLGAVVPQQKNGVTDNVLVGVLDSDVAVGRRNVFVRVFLESLLGIVCEYDERGRCL